MSNKDWNPDLYLKYDKERTQPSIDLVSHINIDKPSKIIDIGCGPGNSTQILVQKWPDANIIGIDNSPAMIDKARKDYPNQEWRIIEAGTDELGRDYDIVFSNATIQWIPDHTKLLKKFHALLSNKGLIAIQIPLFWDMPLGKAIARIAAHSCWNTITQGVLSQFTIHDSSFYYDNLSTLYHSIDIWESNYIHLLDSHLSILEMIKSTGLKPFLDRLENDIDKKDFEANVFHEIIKDYPLQKDGKVLFPFKRLFFIARK